MFRRSPQRLRIVALAVLGALLVLGVGAVVSREYVAHRAEQAAHNQAESTMDGLVFSLRTDSDFRVLLKPSDNNFVVTSTSYGSAWAAAPAGSGRVFIASGIWEAYFAGGRLMLPSVAGPGDQTVTVGMGPSPECDDTGRGCELANLTVRLIARTISDPSVVAVPITLYALVWPFAVTEALRVVDPLLLVGVPVGAVLVGLLAGWVFRRALRPVEKLRLELVEITAKDLRRRVPVPRGDGELRRWAMTTNETLDQLEAAVTRRRSFVDDAAHELRTPLASLLNTLEVAAAHPDQIDPRASLEVALTEARRLQRLADDLLLLARLDRAEPVADRVVHLDAVVAEQVAERQFTDVGPRLRLTTVGLTTVDGARVCGDEGQLGRVLRNLLDNATAFANHAIDVTVTREPGGQVRLEVVDDGPGIPAADRARVFDRFTRLDPAREHHRGGAGLGLAIARDIVTQHGGRIEIADSPAGARVVVRLPAMAGAVTESGGGYEIRTREGFIPTRFPSVRPRPLGESSVGHDTEGPGSGALG